MRRSKVHEVYSVEETSPLRGGRHALVLDTRAQSSITCKALLNDRVKGIAVAVCVIAATLALGVLPGEHVHRSLSGPQEVHRHGIDLVADHDGSSVDHGDHHDVKTLEPTFLSEASYVFARPVVTVDVMPAAPVLQFAGRVESIDMPQAHGPPLHLTPSRAPPA